VEGLSGSEIWAFTILLLLCLNPFPEGDNLGIGAGVDYEIDDLDSRALQPIEQPLGLPQHGQVEDIGAGCDTKPRRRRYETQKGPLREVSEGDLPFGLANFSKDVKQAQ